MRFLAIPVTAFLLLPMSAANATSNKKMEVPQNYSLSGGVKWTGTGVGKSHTGDLKLKSASVQMRGNEIVGGTFVFDMNTIAYENKKLEGHLKSPDFFDVATYPDAKFVLTKATKTPDGGANNYSVTGELTIRDRTEAITFPAQINTSGKTLKANANITIDRTKFGIKYNSKKFFDLATLKDKVISDEIGIALDVSGTKGT